MPFTEKNFKVVDRIIGVLIEEECTALNEMIILNKVAESIRVSDTLQNKRQKTPEVQIFTATCSAIALIISVISLLFR